MTRRSADPRGIALPVVLDRGSEVPLPVQLAGGLREAIDAATLRPGESVPATRELASRLGVARGVVVAAYEQLTAEGYLTARHGQGTRVNPALALAVPVVGGGAHGGTPRTGDAVDVAGVGGVGVGVGVGVAGAGAHYGGAPGDGAQHCGSRDGAERQGDVQASGARPSAIQSVAGSRRDPEPISSPPSAHQARAQIDAVKEQRGAGPLAPGIPITDAVDSPAWRSAWRAAATRAHLAAPALGDPRLRSEIAEHLRRMRYTARRPHDVIVTAGTRDGLGLLLMALGAARDRAIVVGVEDPGLPTLRGVAARYGARIVALPTDAEGLDTARLPDGVLDVVIVTPSHQYPLGGSLPLPRRRELLAWARRSGVVVVEDDFDSELRYTGSPLPTLAALDDPEDGAVVLLGTFSRTIAPALSAGYVLAPAGLRALIEPIRTELGGPVSAVVQEALGGYLASGELRRHTARMLRRYAARRDAVSERLAGAQGVRVRPMDGGLHAVIELTEALQAAPQTSVDTRIAARLRREEAALARADAVGLGAQALGHYWQRRGDATGLAGLVIGMGGADGADFDAALRELRAILSEV